MNKTCARCEKTVYPTEELKCLDKVWHKGCFKCQECGMTLNMRTYKGYGKLPYCEAHVPKAKPTTMAETPELKRIAENTKLQSNVKYHADFEKSKGKFTQVADDPETLRIKANTKIISNVAYHGELEKKAQMDKQRLINENGELVDVPTEYHQQLDNYATEMLPPPNLPAKSHYQTPTTQYQSPQQSSNQHQLPIQKHQNHHHQHHQQPQQHHQHLQQNHHQPQQHHQQPQQHHQQPQQHHQQPQQHHQQPQQHQQIRNSEQYYDDYSYQYQDNQNQLAYGQQYAGPKIGRIQDYDPMMDAPRAPPNTQRASATLIYNSTSDGNRGANQPQQQQSRQIGRVTDMDPLAATEAPRHSTGQGQAAGQNQPANQNQLANQRVYIAMYDYEANDSDEVSFREGDLISRVTSIDEGWMTGQVLRTGRAGMLPANYVQLAPAHHHY